MIRSRAGNLLNKAFAYFRSRRMRLFEQTFPITSETRVLDLGGSPSIWEFAAVHPKLTIANIPSALEKCSWDTHLVGADGCQLPFRDQSFDIVFTNSVIEHVGTRQAQQRFASEVARVGRSYWVQTPNRRFPIELHTMLPLVHHLPKPVRRWILQRFTVWEWLTRPEPGQRAYYVNHVLEEMQLLSSTELGSLFPGALIVRERFFGLSKSLIAVRP